MRIAKNIRAADVRVAPPKPPPPPRSRPARPSPPTERHRPLDMAPMDALARCVNCEHLTRDGAAFCCDLLRCPRSLARLFARGLRPEGCPQ